MKPLITLRKLQAVEVTQKVKQIPMAVDTESKFVWTSGADVMKTFKKYGFVPPSEVRNDYLFKKNREMTDE
jgi:hypothetical protein